MVEGLLSIARSKLQHLILADRLQVSAEDGRFKYLVHMESKDLVLHFS